MMSVHSWKRTVSLCSPKICKWTSLKNKKGATGKTRSERSTYCPLVQIWKLEQGRQTHFSSHNPVWSHIFQSVHLQLNNKSNLNSVYQFFVFLDITFALQFNSIFLNTQPSYVEDFGAKRQSILCVEQMFDTPEHEKRSSFLLSVLKLPSHTFCTVK